ncbi:hypothetical protein [Streptomyces sp. DSM 41534]
MEIAAELAAQPPFAVSVAKQVITAATDAPREAARPCCWSSSPGPRISPPSPPARSVWRSAAI